MNNKLYKTGGGLIGYFAFDEITKINIFNPADTDFSDNRRYNFKLTDYTGKHYEYNNYTMEALINELYQLKLVFSTDKQTSMIKTIGTFITETDIKQKLKWKKQPVCEGFFYDNTRNQVISHFENLPNKYTLNEGVEALNTIFDADGVFANKEKYGSIYWLFFLQSLCNVAKELNLDQIMNKQLFELGTGGVLKTTILTMGYNSFQHRNRFEEIKEGDTKSSIARILGLSTLPMQLNDPNIDINKKDFRGLLKSATYGYTADVSALEQYGNKVNIRPSLRLVDISHNDTSMEINEQDGEKRRFNIVIFTTADTPTDKQRNKLDEVINPSKNGMIVNRLTAIGLEFRKFVTIYFNDLTPEKRMKIRNTDGWSIITSFINHLERRTGITLCDGLKKQYEWDDITKDKTIVFYSQFQKHFESIFKDKGITIRYSLDAVQEFVNLSPLFKVRDDKRTKGKKIVYLLYNEFMEFVKSPKCLNGYVTEEEILKITGLDNICNGFTHKSPSGEGKFKAIGLSYSQVSEYLLNK